MKMKITIVFIILWMIFMYVVLPSTKEGISEENNTKDRLKAIVKLSLSSIFTLRKKMILLFFGLLIIWGIDLSLVDIKSYFTVSLTSLSLLLTTSNISRNLFTPDEVRKLQTKTWEIYLGRFICAAIIWVVINIISLLAPLIPLLNNNNILKAIFLELLLLGILILFDLLVTTIMLYRKKDNL